MRETDGTRDGGETSAGALTSPCDADREGFGEGLGFGESPIQPPRWPTSPTENGDSLGDDDDAPPSASAAGGTPRKAGLSSTTSPATMTTPTTSTWQEGAAAVRTELRARLSCSIVKLLNAADADVLQDVLAGIGAIRAKRIVSRGTASIQ